MTFDNSNRKHLREAEKVAHLADTNRIAYTRKIMSDSFGRAWLHDLLLRCHVFHTPFVAGALDLTAFNCGTQNLGLAIFGDIAAHCPHEYTLMMSEASTKEAANDRRNSESASDTGAGADSDNRRNVSQPISPDTAFGVDAQGFVYYGDQGAEAGAEDRT